MSEKPTPNRPLALALYAVLTLCSFPQEGPGGVAFDFGLALAWFGPAALVVGITGLAPRRAAGAAFLASLASHCLLFYWFYVVTVFYGGMPVWLGVLSPVVPSFYVSLFTALFAWCWTRFAQPSRSPILVGAIAWVAVDWLRGHFLGGFPWATLGYALHLDWPLMGWTRWAGVYALSFFAAAVGIALARVWLDRSPARIRALGVTVACVVVAHGIGLWAPRDPVDSETRVRVAAVQGNIDQGQKWNRALRERILASYLRLSTRAAAEGAEWIVWPETAVPGFIEADPGLRDRIARLARTHEASLIVGGTGAAFDAETGRFEAFFDSAFVFDPYGVVRDRYDKTHLVPFGEFVPLRALFGRFFESLARGLSTADVTPGRTPRTLAIGARTAGTTPLRVGVPICYELLFPHIVGGFGAEQAGVLLAITNDAWYGRTGAPHQFLAMTAMRAAENARWVVRAANTGISAIIDRRGRVREASALFEEAVLVADVPVSVAESPTFYARYGDGFAGLCCIFSVVVFGHQAWRERRLRA